MSVSRLSSRLLALLGLLGSLALGSAVLGCEGAPDHRDADLGRRKQWIQEQTVANNFYLLELLNRPGTFEFTDGWYAVEQDPKTHGAWRWMERRGIVRIMTKPDDAPEARDMDLKIFGWVPYEHAGTLSLSMEFAVNGHVLERFEPPRETFEHTIRVPKRLLDRSDYVDFVITVANAVRPAGDWRDLGFATTGFRWTPAAVP
jgi:hypothetical protein